MPVTHGLRSCDMPTMRTLVILAVTALTAACGSTPTAAPSTSTTTSAPTTTTSTTSTSVMPLYDKWSARFSAIPKPADAPCAPALVQTQGCAAWLTDIVLVASDLRSEIQGKPAYAKTLAQVDKVVDAGAAYGDLKCRQGGGTFELCQAHAFGVAIGSVTITTLLMGDDIGAR